MKVLNVIKNIILDVIIVILLLSIVFGILNRNKPISVFNHYFFTVKSGSMSNTINVGDNIIVKKVDTYKVGDIVTYKKGKSYITHRITKIEGNKVTTKGDANYNEDPSFDKKNILGKFVYKSGWLNFLVNNRIIIILIIIVLYLIEIVIKSMRKKVVENAES